MNDYQKILTSPHHFLLCIVKQRSSFTEVLQKSFIENGKEIQLLTFESKQITMGLAEEIRKSVSQKVSTKRVIIVSFFTFLPEAQNSLLKTVEEVQKDVRFIFVTESKEGVLSTILSRAEVYDFSEGGDKKLFDARFFLATDKTLRMDIPSVKSLLAKKDEEDRKDREAFESFMSGLLLALPSGKMSIEAKKEILTFLPYAKDTGSSPKMILEYLALTLPVVVE